MKKKNITLVFVAIVFSIIVGMIIGKSLLKYKEGEPDVVGSFSMNRDENLTVVATGTVKSSTGTPSVDAKSFIRSSFGVRTSLSY